MSDDDTCVRCGGPRHADLCPDSNHVACPFCGTITRGWRGDEWTLAAVPCAHLVAGFWDSNGFWEPGPFGEAVEGWEEASLMEQAGFDPVDDEATQIPSDEALNEAFGDLATVIRLAMTSGGSLASAIEGRRLLDALVAENQLELAAVWWDNETSPWGSDTGMDYFARDAFPARETLRSTLTQVHSGYRRLGLCS